MPNGSPIEGSAMNSPYGRNRAQTATSAKRLSALMKEQGVSIVSLAASVRIQTSTLENFCAGGPAIPSDVIERIALQLGTNPGYLRAISDEP
jgi:hypothetical protein